MGFSERVDTILSRIQLLGSFSFILILVADVASLVTVFRFHDGHRLLAQTCHRALFLTYSLLFLIIHLFPGYSFLS